MIDPAVSLPDGLLRQVHLTGLLSWGDVHVAQKVSFLFGEDQPNAQLGLALAVRALREGSTCLELDSLGQLRDLIDATQDSPVPESWPDVDQLHHSLSRSAMVSQGPTAEGTRPLRLVDRRLYLERYWQEESTVAAELSQRWSTPVAAPAMERVAEAADALLDIAHDPDQAAAALTPLFSGVSVIAGGPGTGKTYTVARVLGMLHRTLPHPPVIALVAPTGKAAVRMDESLARALSTMPADLRERLSELRASTIHRLLGWTPEARNRFQHDRSNPLPHDVVVVDESSMVSITLMARLLAALRPGTRLVLVGDPHQLAPVEAGAVLADIVDAPVRPAPNVHTALAHFGLDASSSIAVLSRNRRFDQHIATFADAVLAGDIDTVTDVIQDPKPGVRYSQTAEDSDLKQRVLGSTIPMIRAAQAGDAHLALAKLTEHRLLCAHRHGPYGVDHWSRTISAWLLAELPELAQAGQWYPGRGVLVTQNAPELGLFNGDIGVTVADPDGLRVHFARGDVTQAVSPFAMDAVTTVHAMTVHKAQGSQFATVTTLLPPPESPLLTRELVYTAITRAEREISLIGSLDSVRKAVVTGARRASGLADRL